MRSLALPGGAIGMGARVYLPQTGRFLQVDPVPGGSANAYDYVNQDPLNTFDLDGRWFWRVVPKLNCAVAGNRFKKFVISMRKRFNEINQRRDIPLTSVQQWNILRASGAFGDMMEYCGGAALDQWKRSYLFPGR